jgi:hypothetical protein
VKATGAASFLNKMSPPISYRSGDQPPSVSLSLSQSSGLTYAATSSVSGGNAARSVIDFGDGTVVNSASATHTYAVVGTYLVTATAFDAAGASAVAVQQVSVKPSSGGITVFTPGDGSTVNWPTMLVASANPGTPVSVMRVLIDGKQAYAADGDTLQFSIRNKPAWATFNTSTGRLSGTPATTDAGIYAQIAISVSDGTVSASLPAFSIQVTTPLDTNTPPTLSGSPTTTVPAGSVYSFMPSGSDADGDTLAFSIQNKPAWASFNSTNGALTGTPSATSAGTYSNIVISVSDGTNSASLPTFSITVNQVSNGTATLNWTAVTQNTNGTPLTNLSGYRVHYGTAANNMSTVITIANPTVNTYIATNLSSGTWYFGVTAYASDGSESALSNIGSKTIQ